MLSAAVARRSRRRLPRVLATLAAVALCTLRGSCLETVGAGALRSDGVNPSWDATAARPQATHRASGDASQAEVRPQGSSQVRPNHAVGVVRDAETQEAVVAADVEFSFAADSRLEAWRSDTLHTDDRNAGRRYLGTTTASGAFRIACGNSTTASAAGWLMVTAKDGRTGLHDRFSVNAPAAVTVAASGVLSVAGGDGTEWTWRVRAKSSTTRSLVLATTRSERRRVPAGDYVLLLEGPDGARRIDSLRVSAGEHVVLPPPTLRRTPSVRVDKTDDAGVPTDWKLRGWPELDLGDRDSDDLLRVPAFGGIVEISSSRKFAGCTVEERIWVDGRQGADTEQFVKTSPIELQRVRILDATTGAPSPPCAVIIYPVQTRGDSQRLITIRSQSEQDGVLTVPKIVTDPTTRREFRWRLARRGCAPAFAELPDSSDLDSVRVRWQTATRLQICVRTPDGPGRHLRRSASVRIDAVDGGGGPWFGITNARGEVWIEDLPPTELIVSVEHPDYLAAQQRIEPKQRGKLRLTLQPGLTLSGIVLAPNGDASIGTVVELRDAANWTGTSTRLVATDGEGRFEFGGLPDSKFTLFAQRESDGQTWSVRMSGVGPGSDDVRLTLDHEDPQLPGARQLPGGTGRPGGSGQPGDSGDSGDSGQPGPVERGGAHSPRRAR